MPVLLSKVRTIFNRILRSFRADHLANDDSSALRGDLDSYRNVIKDVLKNKQDGSSFAKAIGSVSIEDFESIGRMEADLLFQYGLTDTSDLIDIGCGSGRLSQVLSKSFLGTYLGTDISVDLLEIASRITGRPDFRFLEVAGLTVPTADETADFVCLFSVLTHLRHEESFLYLEDIKRCLRPGGKVVFSFLDFSQKSHWNNFTSVVNELREANRYHVNQFISHDTITAWAEMLEMKLINIHDGQIPYIISSLSSDPSRKDERVTLGQSVCILQKK